MATLITDPDLEQRLIEQRQADGTDKYDEVWEGMYVMSPLANTEHQDSVKHLTTILTITMDWSGLGKVFPGVNVSDREANWQDNYRCPDVAVFLNDTHAQDRSTHWFGGPDFVIEVVSPKDRSEEKLPFYAAVGTRELMLVHREPWKIVLYRLQGNELSEASRSAIENSQIIVSEVVPLNWQLIQHKGRPAIRITHHDGQQQWTIESHPKSTN